MTEQDWIPLSQFSHRYEVSISTLRRRIRANQIEFTYKDGKYLVLDKPLNNKTKRFRATIQKEMNSQNHHSHLDDISHQPRQSNWTQISHQARVSEQAKMSDQAKMSEQAKLSDETKLESLLDDSKKEYFPLKAKQSRTNTIAPPQPSDSCLTQQLPTTKTLAESSPVDGKQQFLTMDFHALNQSAASSQAILATTNRLLNELKKAYSLILQEKEEHLILVQSEVSDLKTLVLALEDENERLHKEKEKLSPTKT